MNSGIPFLRFMPLLKGVGAPPEQAGSIPHETDNDIVSEKRKPCQPKNWANRACHLNNVTDLVVVAIGERSWQLDHRFM